MTSQDYFFLVGCPRSGTTLLSVLLDRHTRLCVPPETAFFDEIGRRLWRRSNALALTLLKEWRRLPELQMEPEEVLRRISARRPRRAELLAAILDLYAERQGKARCGEKTPRHLLHVPTILKSFPKAQIVCVLRDGRDVALSLNAMPWHKGGLRTAARLWRKNARLMDAFAHRYADRFRVVRYEDLVANTEHVLRGVMAFLGETLESHQCSPDVLSRVVLPRSMEWKGEALKQVNQDAVDRRRREAAPADLRFLEDVLHADLIRYEYTST